MRLCNIMIDGAVHLGIVTDKGAADATAAGFPYDMDAVIAGAGMAELTKIAADGTLPILTEPEYADVVNRAGKLLCVGLNYRSHASKVSLSTAENPILFSKFADALAPSGAKVPLPEWEDSYDYEAELVVIMGKKAWNVAESEAMDYIFGYTCGNDLSCRDAQMRSSQWLIGKALPCFGPCGPCIVTADEFDPREGKNIKSYVNGELRQDGSTADMIFDCASVISYASKYVCLEPGDMIFTGTPSGVMLEKTGESRRWLKKGDRVDVVIEGIGTLTNTMV